MRFDILTIFPGFFASIFEHGILRRALGENRLSIHLHDLRDFTHDRHRTVDDRPFGGGEGMVLKPEPIAEALASIGIVPKSERGTEQSNTRVLLLSAQGQTFTQSAARQFCHLDRIVLLCGRYEGIDERINQLYCDGELSVGDYILSGGELPAAIVVDAVMRLIPGVLGNEASGEFESFGVSDDEITTEEDGVPRSQHGAGGILDYPHYTRPAEFAGVRVPEALLNGDHQQIRRWRREQQLRKTIANRPDLLTHAALSKEDQKILANLQRNDSAE